jgi:hypothetical protein
MKTLLVLAVCLSTLVPCHASPESHRAATERFFKATQMQKQYEVGLLAGFDASSGLTDERVQGLPKEQRDKLANAKVKIKAKMIELMGWEKVKPEMVQLYTKHFSESEIDSITKMMETPTGQLMISKQVALLPEAMAIGQKKAQSIMPEIMKIMQEEMK